MFKRRSGSVFFVRVFFICAAIFLQSCGFHLRGLVEMPPELKSIYIEGGLPNSQMREILRQKLIGSQVNVLERPEKSGAVLRILKDKITRRIASVNTLGQPNEYELKYSLSYQLEDGRGRALLVPREISLLRTYRYDPDNILSVEEEAQRIKLEMARSAVNQMLRQISAGMRHRLKAPKAGTPGSVMAPVVEPQPDQAGNTSAP
ncbi:hypothetical protein MNBD_GAMMA24-2326 [hydrothermal vent metagenome]|uniref:LPS-assembly lipoprotein LptE n=1 Tax=hydrothermal vent metagenome TaxID=652676 RepID=A0A3B1BC26_9ZZZZ